ncbi:MAG: oligosaccharide flippase family protein [Betaproteobacteria bacterium]|jgi:O-antigen/teichoic acid export membrane protein
MSRPSFLSSVFTVAGGTAVAQAIALGALPFITRLYPPELYGGFVIFLAWGGFLLPVVCARFEVAIALPSSLRAASAVAWGSLGIALGVSALCALAVAVAWAMYPPARVAALALLPLYVLLGGAVQVLGNWAARVHAYRRLSLSRIVQAAATALLSLAWVPLWGAQALGLVVATLAGQLIALGVLAQGLSQTGFRLRAAPRQVWRLMRHFRRLTLFNVPHVLSDAAQGSGLPLLIAHFFGAPAAAYYAFSTRLLKAPLGLVSGAVSQVYYPRAASHRHDDERLRRDALRILAVSTTGVMLVWPLLLLVPDAAYAWAFGAAWAEVGGYLRALSPWILSAFVAAPLSVLYLVKERFGLDFSLGLAGTLLAFALLVGAWWASGEVIVTLWVLALGMTAYNALSTWFEFRYVLGRRRVHG